MPNADGFRQLIFKYADLPGLQLQLCEPGPADTPQRRFLETKGPGVFHLGFAVGQLSDAEQAGKTAGLQPLMRGRRPDGSGFTYFRYGREGRHHSGNPQGENCLDCRAGQPAKGRHPYSRSAIQTELFHEPQAKSDCELLLGKLLPFAEKQWKKYGTFMPFGTGMRPSGEVVPRCRI